MRTLTLALIGNCFLATVSLSQTAAKVPVKVFGSGKGLVGEKLVYAVKEEVRKSSTMELARHNQSRMVLRLSTIETDESGKGGQAAYAACWYILDPNYPLSFYLSSRVGVSDSNRVAEAAKEIVASTDKQIAYFSQWGAAEGEVAKRLKELQQIAMANPDHSPTLLDVANFAHDNHFYDRAIDYYEMYLATNPHDVDALVDLGICYNDLGDYVQAGWYMREAIKHSPNHLLAHFNLGIVEMKAGNMQTALEWFKKTLSLSPNSEIGKRSQLLIDQNLSNRKQ